MINSIGITSAAFLLLVGAGEIAGAEIKILAGSAIETGMAVLIPQFEQSSGHKVIYDFITSAQQFERGDISSARTDQRRQI